MTQANEIAKASAEMITELNTIRNTETAIEINKRIASINESLKEDSTASRNERIKALLSMDKNALFMEFIIYRL